MNVFMFRIYYLITATINGVFGMAIPVYYEGVLKFDPMQVGLLIAVPSFVMFFQPVWGIIVDKYEKPKEVAVFCILSSSTILLALIWAKSFNQVLLIVFIYSLLRTPVWSTVDNIIVTYCINNNIAYGPLRVFASIAWGSSLLIFLPFILTFGFVSYFIIEFFVGIILSFIVMRFPSETKVYIDGEEDNLEFMDGIRILVKDKGFYFLIFYTLFFSSMFVTNLNYQTMYLKSLGVGATLIALITFISILPEFIILPLIERVEKRYNPITWLIIVCVIYIFKFVVTGMTTNVLIITLVSMLHGVGMSFYIPVFIKYFKVSVPSNVSTTALTINGFMAAVSGVSMSILAGYVTENYGISNVFFLNVFTLTIAIVILVFYRLSMEKDKKIINQA